MGVETRMALVFVAEWTGLEPATPGVTGRYSNQLNYHSMILQTADVARENGSSSIRHRASHAGCWWVLTGSNRRHSPCKGDALPAELSTRTNDAIRIKGGKVPKFRAGKALKDALN